MSFERVCADSELEANTPLRVTLGGEEIVVVRDSAGDVWAIGDRCTHGDISLSEGFVEGDEIECWAHGSTFSLKTGWPSTLPAFEPVPTYAVSVEGGDILVDPTPIMKEQS